LYNSKQHHNIAIIQFMSVIQSVRPKQIKKKVQ